MQAFLPENLPTLVVASTTTVTMATIAQNGLATRVNIGGQQYTNSSTLTLNTATTGANGLDTGSLGAIQLWYVYAIVNNSTFAMALVASQTSPSTGPLMPVGYGTAYKLIGAFYTNGSSQVGAMVTIAGKAMSDKVSFTPTITDPSATITVVNDLSYFQRYGSHVLLVINCTNITVATATPTGPNLNLPAALTSITQSGDPRWESSSADCFAFTSLRYGGIVAQITTGTNLLGLNLAAGSSFSTAGTGRAVRLSIMYPVQGWNETLL